MSLTQIFLDRRAALVRYFTLRMGSSAAAEDLVQDIFLKISERPNLDDGVQNPAAFLYRLGSNLMLDRIKQTRRTIARDDAWQFLAGAAPGSDAADLPSTDAGIDAKARLSAIGQALEELSPPCRTAFRLHKLEGLSHSETAATMGISRSGVEKHISAAMKHLLARLAHD